MSYAVLISGATETPTTLLQLIFAHYNGKNFAWSRITDGGRGESNAWSVCEYANAVAYEQNNNKHTVGAVLSTPLTKVDELAIANDEKPNVLIQKLTKQYGLREKTVNAETIGEVIRKVNELITQDPNLLAEYRSDGRSDKSATITQATPTPITTVAPSIVIERTKPSSNTLAFIPSMSNPELSGYFERTFAGGKTETNIYDNAISNQRNVALVGDAGTGKTTSTMRYAALRGLNYYRVNFNAGVESSQLFGKILPNENGNLFWQDAGFTQCYREGNAVIHLDELSFILAKQSGVLFPTLDSTRTLTLLDNKGESIPAGENLLIVGSYNDKYRGNNQLNQAFIDRFHHKLRFEYDITIERNFIKSETLLQLAKQMRADSIAGIYETPISTRLLKNFQAFAQELGYEYAVDNFLNSFTDEERPAVKILLEAHHTELQAELTN